MMASVTQTQRNDSILMATIQSVEMNENGVKCLQQFQYESAIENFGASLKMLNQILSSDTFVSEEQYQNPDQDMVADATNDQDGKQTSSDCDEEQHVPAPLPSSSALVTTPESNHLSQEDLVRHRSMIYKKPIGMSNVLTRLGVSHLTYLTVVEISISVMFNFGLSHHLLSVSGKSENQEKVMDQAVALYELTHSLQLQEGIELCLEYTMGIICNLGHIHQLRGDRDKSSKCFQHLLSIFCYLQSEYMIEQVQSNSNDSVADIRPTEHVGDESSSSSSTASLRNLLDTDVFFHSVSHLLLINSTAAAA
jgi:hypothetical protein